MSAFMGRLKNKSKARQESKNYLFFKNLVAQQDYSILHTPEFQEKKEQFLKESLERKDHE